jgi:hypothetical protein
MITVPKFKFLESRSAWISMALEFFDSDPGAEVICKKHSETL